MKSYRKELWFNIPARRAFVNITPDEEVILPRRAAMAVKGREELKISANLLKLSAKSSIVF